MPAPILRALALLAALCVPAAAAAPIPLPQLAGDAPVGAHVDYVIEPGARLALDEARREFASGHFSASASAMLNFGLGSRPVWMRIVVSNPTGAALVRRVRIENSWLDELDLHFVRDGREEAHYALGDSLPFPARPLRGRFFAVERPFEPGLTEIYLRAATADPLVVPIFISDVVETSARSRSQGYSYGFLYGYLVALLAYYAVLFVNIRERRYALYAVFLGSFLAMNVAYTGHGFAWFWPNSVTIQRWVIPVLIVLFAVAGLAFARSFLDLRRNLPAADRLVGWVQAAGLAALAAAVAAGGDQLAALEVAFAFVTLFSCTMLGLGVVAFRARIASSGYFLIANVASMLGTATTSLSVWGWIGFADWRFRAVEAGMLIDATLLALALGSQFRFVKMEMAVAEFARTKLADSNAALAASLREVERLASTDRLTGLWNRLHLEGTATREMERVLRYGHAVSLLLFDIDHFKRINDTRGHHAGDAALVELAELLRASVRASDVVTRWGGEEFLVLMPETTLAEAASAAEKLRKAVEGREFARGFRVTISVGVAEWRRSEESLDTWIQRADRALYRAKEEGRNRTVVADGRGSGEAAKAREAPLLSLAWSERYESGVAEIDRQHRLLFESANSLLALLPAFADPASAPDARGEALWATAQLLAGVREHFAAEEAILASANWPRVEEHRAEHRRLLERAEALRTDLESGDPGPAGARMIDFVAREIVAGHLVGADRDYFPAFGRDPQVA